MSPTEDDAVVTEESKESDKEEKNAEPEEEDKANEEKTEPEIVVSTLATEATEKEEEEVIDENKYQLLERLFAFIKVKPGDCEDDRLNPVLSGYFCKLVTLLISRK